MSLFAKQMDRLKLDKDGSIIWKHITDLIIKKYFFESWIVIFPIV